MFFFKKIFTSPSKDFWLDTYFISRVIGLAFFGFLSIHGLGVESWIFTSFARCFRRFASGLSPRNRFSVTADRFDSDGIVSADIRGLYHWALVERSNKQELASNPKRFC